MSNASTLASARKRGKAFRLRRKRGQRYINCALEVAPGIIITQIDIDLTLAEDFVVSTLLLPSYQANFEARVIEAIKLFLQTRLSPTFK